MAGPAKASTRTTEISRNLFDASTRGCDGLPRNRRVQQLTRRRSVRHVKHDDQFTRRNKAGKLTVRRERSLP